MTTRKSNHADSLLVRLRPNVQQVIWLAVLLTVQSVFAQTPEDFGYNRLKVNGREAQGLRPLLVILVEHDGYPTLAHDRDYYDNLVFNYLWTDENGALLSSLNGYYLVNSNARFFWTRAGAGTYGPYQFAGADLGEMPETKRQPRQALALQAAANDGFDFDQYDDNADGRITNDELCVLVIENLTTDEAASRGTEPACVRPDGSKVDVCLGIAIAGHQAGLMSMAHELAHSLGTIDLYGPDFGQNFEYSLMGATIYGAPDVMRTYHLDPWHKIQLGWVEPKIYSIDTPGSDTIGAADLVEGDQPVILYSPDRGTNEYYLLEYRRNSRPAGDSYDAHVPGTGLVVWQIKTDDNKVPVTLPSRNAPGLDWAVFIRGAPTFSQGTGDVWGQGIIPYSLKWLDGLGGDMKIKVGNTIDSGNRLRVSWDTYDISTPYQAQMKFLYYNAEVQSAAVGVIDEHNDHFTLSSYDPGYFSSWTHIVGDASDIFYYDAPTGAAALGYVDAAGRHDTTASVAPGYFGTGWTHIVHHQGYLFFYHAGNGMAAIGQMSTTGFRQYGSYGPGTFGLGWTQIVSTDNGLLFYNAANGGAAGGDWEYTRTGAPGTFPVITGVSFKQLIGYPPYSLTTGWTHITDTSDGVLFYRAGDGLHVMLDIESNGQLVTRSNTVQTLRTEWTHIVSANEDILFYDAVTGDAAVGEILKGSPLIIISKIGSLTIRREFPAYFSPGWTHIVATVDPYVVR